MIGIFIFKCYRCGSSNIDKEKNFCFNCNDETKFTKLEQE